MYCIKRILFNFQAILCFIILAYIHNAFSRTPINCLDHVKTTWPRDGVLRVTISRGQAVRKLSENELKNNISKINITLTNGSLSNESVIGNVTDHEHIIRNQGDSNSTVEMYGVIPNGRPEKNRVPVRDTLVPSAFDFLGHNKEGIYYIIHAIMLT